MRGIVVVARSASAWVALPLVLLAAGGCQRQRDTTAVVDFWVLGREGEVVQQLVPEFERRTPGVRVQQIPWSAAHGKLLTAYVGEAMPDVMRASDWSRNIPSGSHRGIARARARRRLGSEVATLVRPMKTGWRGKHPGRARRGCASESHQS
jgi:hypothetical protein